MPWGRRKGTNLVLRGPHGAGVFRDEVEALRQQELEIAIKRLSYGADPGETLERLSHNLTRKFSHAPSQALRKADESGNASLISAMRTLFNLQRK